MNIRQSIPLRYYRIGFYLFQMKWFRYIFYPLHQTFRVRHRKDRTRDVFVLVVFCVCTLIIDNDGFLFILLAIIHNNEYEHFFICFQIIIIEYYS